MLNEYNKKNSKNDNSNTIYNSISNAGQEQYLR